MGHKIKDIAAALGAGFAGDGEIEIKSASEPGSATADQLAIALNDTFAKTIADGAARAALLWDGADWQALGLRAAILPVRPRFAMSGLTAMLDPGQGFAPGIHPTALVDESAELGAGVAVGPYAIISAGAQIGAGSVIGPHAFVGHGARVGAMSFLREHVSIGARAVIGERFIAQPGVRVGGDGFSFVTPEKGAVEAVRENPEAAGEAAGGQSWARIHSLGAVRIGDDVELGANTCVDCGTVRDTVVGSRTKCDNLVQIGHNVVVGDDCLLCAQVGVAGSTRIGNHVVLGGQTGVSDNVFIGDGAITGGATKVLSNVPKGKVVLGYPAVKMETQLEIHRVQRRLPRLARDVAALKEAVFKTGAGE